MSDMMDKLDAAMELVHSGDPRALEALLWLWRHGAAADPEFEFLKHTILVSLFIELCERQPSARAEVIKERDAAFAALERGYSAGGLDDALSFCHALRDDAPALAWFSRAEAGLPRDPRTTALIASLLGPAHRWADLGRFLADPVALLETRAAEMERALQTAPPAGTEDTEGLELWKDTQREALRDEAARLVRALLAAGRDAEAIAVQSRALQLDPSQKMKEALGGRVGRA